MLKLSGEEERIVSCESLDREIDRRGRGGGKGQNVDEYIMVYKNGQVMYRKELQENKRLGLDWEYNTVLKQSKRMSIIKNANLLKDPQSHHFCIKGLQDSSRQTANSIEETDFRYLSIENYLNIEKKSKSQILNSQFYYLNHLKLIPSAFHLNFDRFQIPNPTTSQPNPPTSFSSTSSTQTLQNILKYNKNKDFLTSYTGFTRKTTTSLFLLINCQQDAKSQNHNNNLKLKISFLNYQGQVLHVCSNLDHSHVDKVNKIIKKHFSCLKTVIVLLNKSLSLQQSEQILKVLIQKSDGISKIILFPKIRPTHQTFQGVEPLIESNEPYISQFASHSLIFEKARGIKDLNIKVLNSSQGRLQAELVENLLQRSMQMLEIQDFVFEKMIRGEVIPDEMVFRNEWMINVTSLIFNILTSAKRNLISSMDEVSVQEEVQCKLYNLFAASLQKRQQQNSLSRMDPELKGDRGSYELGIGECANKCFPYLFETSKKCLVCRSSKPKFGCRECSSKYKREIHLCVSGCFKLFHLETLKYISNQIALSGAASGNIIGICSGYSDSMDGNLRSVRRSNLENPHGVLNNINKHYKIKSQSIKNDQSITQNQLLDRKFKRKQIKKITKSLSKQHFLIQTSYHHRQIYQLANSPLNTPAIQMRKSQFFQNMKLQSSIKTSLQPQLLREQDSFQLNQYR